ncbi:hypothetical protein RFI_05222, partial [Reticulomyxa filosa]
MSPLAPMIHATSQNQTLTRNSVENDLALSANLSNTPNHNGEEGNKTIVTKSSLVNPTIKVEEHKIPMEMTCNINGNGNLSHDKTKREATSMKQMTRNGIVIHPLVEDKVSKVNKAKKKADIQKNNAPM